MKTILRFEEIDLQPHGVEEIPADDDINVDAMILQNARDDESGMFDAIGVQHEALRRISEVADACISVASKRGLSDSVASAAQVAVENMCLSAGVCYERTHFAPQVTAAARQKNAEVAFESFSSAMKSIWQKIVEMMRRFVAWWKNKFSRRQIVDVTIKKKIDLLEKKINARKEEAKAPPPAMAAVIEPKSYHDATIAKRLSVRGTVPQNVELLRCATNHFAMMRQFYTVGLQYSREICNDLLKAESLLKKDGSEFNDQISDVLGKIMTRALISKPCKHPPRTFSKGVLLYEEPLVFGERSYFRTSVNSIADIVADDVVAEVSDATSPIRSDPDQKLYPLSDVHREALMKNLMAHSKMMNSYSDSFDQVVNATDRLAINLTRMDVDPQAKAADVDRSTRRARLLSRAFSLFCKQFNSIAKDLYEYDQAVVNSLLEYAIKCVD